MVSYPLVLALTGLSLAVSAPCLSQPVTSPTELPAIRIKASEQMSEDSRFSSARPAQVNKSAVSLSRTPQSITVVNRTQMDAQQVRSLTDVLQNVQGVVSGQLGRRGWDDVIIRGQVASDSLFVDGLRTGLSNRVAEQQFGFERVEVLKGPASVLYGQVLPGGLVNMVSKRPQAETFADAQLTVGSHALRQATLDMGTPLSENGKSALRLVSLAMNSHDATDYVWFKDRYIAPSLSLDLGPKTDLTILTSYQERRYVRQQGLPLLGSVFDNPNGPIARDRFIGEPDAPAYRGFETRVGYALAHRMDNGWELNQNLRWQTFSMSGTLVANGTMRADGQNLRRTGTDQRMDGRTFIVDTHARRQFDTKWGKHELVVGLDYLNNRQGRVGYVCKVGDLNVYRPVYGSAIVCPEVPNSDDDNTVRATGLYARDHVSLGENWDLVVGLRHDLTSTNTVNYLGNSTEKNRANATTGSAAVMVQVLPGLRPYLSYASSFFPNTGADRFGSAFKPERGQQWEAGVKWANADETTQITAAIYDLKRQNVLAADPLYDGYSIAVGEQGTKGAEIGMAVDMGNGLSLMGGYSYTKATVLDDGGQLPSTNGANLNNVPRHTVNLSARYRLQGAYQGWELNGAMRGFSSRSAYSYELPGYVVADLGVAYDAGIWRAALTVKNVLDKEYYAGGVRNAVAMGDGRIALLSLGYRY